MTPDEYAELELVRDQLTEAWTRLQEITADPSLATPFTRARIAELLELADLGLAFWGAGDRIVPTEVIDLTARIRQREELAAKLGEGPELGG